MHTFLTGLPKSSWLHQIQSKMRDCMNYAYDREYDEGKIPRACDAYVKLKSLHCTSRCTAGLLYQATAYRTNKRQLAQFSYAND